jgi:hypothetical protein
VNSDYLYAEPALPFPHIHYYRTELDDAATNFFQEIDWEFFPLTEKDEEEE